MKAVKELSIVYSLVAKEYLRKLHPSVKSGLREIIEELIQNPVMGKPLQEEFKGFRSLRFKKYRVIYRYVSSKKRIEVLFAGPRVEVYSLFAEYLKKLSRK